MARLLDQTNQNKSIDKMRELLTVLGVVVEPEFMVPFPHDSTRSFRPPHRKSSQKYP